MPFTLTSLGEYVARQRVRRTFSLSTALVVPAASAYPGAVERWSESLAEQHPALHACGFRAVALITDMQLVAVVPFAWVPRLPLKKPPTLTSQSPVISGVPPFVPEPQQEHPERSGRAYFHSSRAVSAQSLRKGYEESRDKLAWWEGFRPGEDIGCYEKRLLVTSELRQMNTKWSAGTRLVRKLDTSEPTPWANTEGRDYYRDDAGPLWLDEDIFRVYAQDREDFDAHFVLLSMSALRTVAIVDRASRLVVGLANVGSDAQCTQYMA